MGFPYGEWSFILMFPAAARRAYEKQTQQAAAVNKKDNSPFPEGETQKNENKSLNYKI